MYQYTYKLCFRYDPTFKLFSSLQTVLSGKVWQGIAMAIDLNNVTVELLLAHADGQECPEQSLAKLDFICSTLKFDSYSDQSKDIDLVSNEIVISDTRFRG